MLHMLSLPPAESIVTVMSSVLIIEFATRLNFTSYLDRILSY
jgi:hypothetical protein